jgi:hypothetical protein
VCFRVIRGTVESRIEWEFFPHDGFKKPTMYSTRDVGDAEFNEECPHPYLMVK